MLAMRGFAQTFGQRKILGLQFGLGVGSFNNNQYNSIAAYSNAHRASSNVYSQFVLALSVFPVVSKLNADITAGGSEISNKVHANIFPQIYSTDGFTLTQSLGFGEINFNYRILGTLRTLVIPAIGVGFMSNNIYYQYKSLADAKADKEEQNDDDGGDNNTNINVAKNKIYYLHLRLNYLIHARKSLWWGFQLGYKYSFHEDHILYNPDFPVKTNHLLNGFYGTVIIAL